MLSPTFSFHLNNDIQRSRVAVGKYDGKTPTLTCATNGNKVLLHNAHENDRVKYLNINREITGLRAGNVNPEIPRDILLVGSPTNLLAYDVHENSDNYYLDVPDGVSCMSFGTLSGKQHPLAIVGGNCSVQGFNHMGNEEFWTVTGGMVTSFSFCDADKDGQMELLVGSDDFEIRCFKEEETIFEVTETDAVSELTTITGSRYGYGLSNGTIGVYDGPTRLWRVKAKDEVTSLIAFDLDDDGVPELISGWSNGKIEARKEHNGEVIYREHLGSAIAGLVSTDYRMDGREQLVCCSTEGQVRGYLPASEELCGQAMDNLREARELESMQDAKVEKLMELRSLEKNLQKMKLINAGGAEPGSMENKLSNAGQQPLDVSESKLDGMQNPAASKLAPSTVRSINSSTAIGRRPSFPGTIPVDTQINLKLEPSLQESAVLLHVSANSDVVVRMVLVFSFDGGVFENSECQMLYSAGNHHSVVVPLRPHKDVATTLHVQVSVCARGSGDNLHVFELPQRLPKFVTFAVDPSAADRRSASFTSFTLPGRPSALLPALNRLFLLNEHTTQAIDPERGGELDLVSLRDGSVLSIIVQTPASMNGCTVEIRCDSMDCAADIIQELAGALNLAHLESYAEYPNEMDTLKELIDNVESYSAVRVKLTAEMADHTMRVKDLVVKAEDSRMLWNMEHMKKSYQELYGLNADLLQEYTKRATNHEQLLLSLREMNNIIQRASRLRVGRSKTEIIGACRLAIKKKNFGALYQVITTGTTK